LKKIEKMKGHPYQAKATELLGELRLNGLGERNTP
jgi:hypothetical protein